MRLRGNTSDDEAVAISHEIRGTATAVVKPAGAMILGQRSNEIVKLVEQLVAAGIETIIFDLSGITKIDSTGVGQFISSYNRINSAGGAMRMASAADSLRKVFRVTRLDTAFPFYSTVADALGA